MGLAVALTSWAMARSAEAADAEVPARVSLRWTAPDECPDDAQVVSAVEQRLGESLQRARPQQLVVRAHLVGARGAYSAKLRFEGPNGVEERYLEHPDCQKLMQASALVMALTIDPERVSAREHEGEVASEGDRSSPPVASATPPRPPSAAEEQAAPRSEVGAREPAPPTERSSLTPPLASLTAPRTAPGVRDASSSAPATFDAELRLIELAKSDLDAGRLEAALGWIDEHQRHFRGGVFAPERDALRVRARCARSPDPGLARAFAARRPGSPLAARLFRECEPKTGAIDK